MSDKNIEKQWHSETARAERKARLNQMKDKNGGKKPIRLGSPVVRVVTIVVLVLAILAAAAWFALNSGLPQQQLSAMSVNGGSIKVVELNYYYYMLANNFGIDLSDKATAEKALQGPSYAEGFATLHDYLIDSSAKYAQENYLLANEATQAGLTLDEKDRTALDNFYASIQNAADQAGVSKVNYMAKYFGKGATEASLTPALERILLAQKFSTQKKAELPVAEADIKAYYDEHKNEFDLVDYRSFEFAAELAEDATEDQRKTALADAKAKADAMATLVRDEESFKAQALANASADQKESYEQDDASLSVDVGYYDTYSMPVQEWLFDGARKAGDIGVVEDATSSTYTVLYFLERKIDDTPLVDVRHILIKADPNSATAEELASAKSKAEEILAQYQSGAKTEDTFAELAKTNSEDNAAAGGLYQSIFPGQMIDTFNDWIFDTVRKTGDTGIVETPYGYHVMYFVKQSGQQWSAKIREILASEAYANYLKEQSSQHPFTLNNLGLRFVP